MKGRMIEVIDYGGGNIGSMSRCLDRLGASWRMADAENPPSGEHPLLFPGVGAFGAAMANLKQSGLAERLRGLLRDGTPYLGVCIGLQVLFESSEEAPGVEGLGVIPGQVVRFRAKKTPQIGWNWITPVQTDWEGQYVYFVNSYYPEPTEADCVLYRADYEGAFTAAIQRNNLTAFQFHPEKSGLWGQQLIERWLRHVNH